jgi:hypothetical protein
LGIPAGYFPSSRKIEEFKLAKHERERGVILTKFSGEESLIEYVFL